MIPVLAVTDIAAARAQLTDVLGFSPAPGGRLSWGGADVALCTQDAPPAGLIALPLDHVAFAVADVTATAQAIAARGAALHAGFTPDGPREIAAFFDAGMRYVFFAGPDGAPVEFCTDLGAPQGDGHAHFGLRAADIATAEAACAAHGATVTARYALGDPARPVNVCFMQAGATTFEIFDEPAPATLSPTRWIGLLRA